MTFTHKSPTAQVIQGSPVPKNAIEKKMKVSTVEPITEDTTGAFHQTLDLRKSKILPSSSWATKNALPDAKAVLSMAKASASLKSACQIENSVDSLALVA